MRPDPFFQEIPWEIITDDSGAVIGEVFLTLPDPPPRKQQRKWGTTSSAERVE
ncbi:hypothetical protein [Paenibacillus donghaensis]|uniref:hypothetical protein n=1 Tax=Paenibacillus donghaensis TaxID=414771 RepID=UPI001470D053|nr:hypothetical protein [Paenibacillus donghaensis]